MDSPRKETAALSEMHEEIMTFEIITAHAGADSISDAVTSWYGELPMEFGYPAECQYSGFRNPNAPSLFVMDGKTGMLPAYQRGFEWALHASVLAYLHDDTLIHDKDWVSRVLAEFEDPTVGLVGFGGALGHGSYDLYKAPYDYHQLARHDFMSNMTDAENHGKRFTGSCDVAVLDGFALIVRREILEKIGGWPISVPHDWKDCTPVGSRLSFSTCKRCQFRSDSPVIPPCQSPIGYVCYDYWLSCMTRRLGYRIRLVGVPVTHLGGRTFVKLGLGRDEKHWKQYLDSHQYIYDEFRDVLPYRVRS